MHEQTREYIKCCQPAASLEDQIMDLLRQANLVWRTREPKWNLDDTLPTLGSAGMTVQEVYDWPLTQQVELGAKYWSYLFMRCCSTDQKERGKNNKLH